MRKLFLDDQRDPWDSTWDVVRSAQEFKQYVKSKGVPDFVSFDHDLHEEHYSNLMYVEDATRYNELYKKFTVETGLHCAKWLCDYCVKKKVHLPKVNVHSMNPVGANNIADILLQYSLFYFHEELDYPIKQYHLGAP